jgi:Zn-dependent peptidase ImmA (M78 family)/transcriptional regulator with XRE-family HTH domain
MKHLEVFSRRLKNARLMRGFSMEELSEKLELPLSRMAISNYENMKSMPNSTILIALAKALNVSVDYFFRPFNLRVESINFRKKARLGQKQIDSLKEMIIDYAERYIEIESICAIKSTFKPFTAIYVKTKAEVIDAASKLRHIWCLGTDGIVNIIELLEEQGIKVLEIEAPSTFDGLSTIINNEHIIVVLNSNLSPERKRFTALHELGHLILKFDDNIVQKEEEYLCHLFASEMLIPSSTFIQLIGESRRDISYIELQSIQKHFGISCDALMYKAKSLGIISEHRHKGYYIEKNKHSNVKNIIEKSHYPEEKSMRFIRLVYRALSDELISFSKAASLLNKSLQEVQREALLI